MPRATTCVLNGEVIDVVEALRRKSRLTPSMTADFRCTECGKGVRPHKDGGHGAAHFEHLRRNAECSRSDPLVQRP
jgi:hypothetical protein